MPEQLAAIIVNFNRGDLLCRAVDSLLRQSRPPDRIIVVDNGSTDDSLSRLQAKSAASIEVFRLNENLGASGGFHHGVLAAIASGEDRLLLLDSDVVLAPDCVREMQRHLSTKPDVGVVGPKVYHWDSENLLQEFGGWVDWIGADLRRNFWRHDEASSGIVTENHVVDYVPACCLLTGRSAIEKAGNIDPGWFLYWDDIDFCSRIRRAGFAVEAVASARVQHYGGGANKTSLLPVYYGWRNRAVYFIRNTPAEMRETTLRALFTDFLLARFTCNTLGLSRTAAIMELGVEDALNGVFGKKEFSKIDLSLDDPRPTEPASAEDIKVHHVIDSATVELARIPGATIVDRFGKRLPAARAFELRKRFETSDLPTLNDWVSRGLDGGRGTE